MTQPTSPRTFDDVRETLLRAVDSEKGIRISFDDEKAATHFRHRCNSFRVADRKANTELYQMGDPLYGCSVFDVLVLTIEGSVLTIRKQGELKIEEII